MTDGIEIAPENPKGSPKYVANLDSMEERNQKLAEIEAREAKVEKKEEKIEANFEEEIRNA